MTERKAHCLTPSKHVITVVPLPIFSSLGHTFLKQEHGIFHQRALKIHHLYGHLLTPPPIPHLHSRTPPWTSALQPCKDSEAYRQRYLINIYWWWANICHIIAALNGPASLTKARARACKITVRGSDTPSLDFNQTTTHPAQILLWLHLTPILCGSLSILCGCAPVP